MSIFDTIRNAIFHRGGQTQATTGGQAAGTVNRGSTTATGTSAPQAAPRPASATPAAPAQRPSAAPATPAAAAPAAVDVEDVLENMVREKGQKLNWRSSIVDLMKLLDLDSSLDNRRSLARELGYTGDQNDSATMNVWLHRQVMRKLAENGGHVPSDLKD